MPPSDAARTRRPALPQDRRPAAATPASRARLDQRDHLRPRDRSAAVRSERGLNLDDHRDARLPGLRRHRRERRPDRPRQRSRLRRDDRAAHRLGQLRAEEPRHQVGVRPVAARRVRAAGLRLPVRRRFHLLDRLLGHRLGDGFGVCLEGATTAETSSKLCVAAPGCGGDALRQWRNNGTFALSGRRTFPGFVRSPARLPGWLAAPRSCTYLPCPCAPAVDQRHRSPRPRPPRRPRCPSSSSELEGPN